MIVPNGADMAHFNPVNFTDIAAAGIWVVLHKSNQGTHVLPDNMYAKRKPLAKQIGLGWAAYDFATGDPVAQNVAEFLKCAALDADDAAVLDFEDNTQSEMTGEEAYEWLDRVQQATGRAAIIYGGNRIREQIDPQAAKWIDMAKVVRQWQCRYIKGQPADNAALFKQTPPIPPWNSCFGIQYTGDGVGPPPHTVNGLQSGADLNVFMPGATKEQLLAAWPGAALGGAS